MAMTIRQIVAQVSFGTPSGSRTRPETIELRKGRSCSGGVRGTDRHAAYACLLVVLTQLAAVDFR